MKLLKNYAAVLLLSVIVLASSASADWTSQVGGVETSSSNGATAGNILTNSVTYDTTSTPIVLPDGSTITGYDQVLTEYLSATATVGNGATGDASVSYVTNGEQAFAQTTDSMGSYVSTSLEGTVTASATKTSADGVATANAYMYALSGIDNEVIVTTSTGTIGFASVGASTSMTGEGSTLAQVEDGVATYDSEYYTGNALAPVFASYSKGAASGDITLTASNVDDDSLAKLGGSVSGTATISANSVAWADATLGTDGAYGQTYEYLTLTADRGVSYAGKSYVDGYLDGAETAESVYEVPAVVAPVVVAHEIEVDIESTSTIEAEATALNRKDHATTTSLLLPTATVANGLTTSLTTMSSTSEVDRLASGGDLKAEAEGYIPDATWQASSQITGYDVNTPAVDILNHYASTSGETGAIGNGDTGFGTGAWIQAVYNRPQTATVSLVQTAATTAGAAAETASSVYTLNLDGVKATGTQEDAVGAFGGVANQVVRATRGENPASANWDVESYPTSATNDIHSIEWLEGENTNSLPGWYSSSIGAVTVNTATGALNRIVTITM